MRIAFHFEDGHLFLENKCGYVADDDLGIRDVIASLGRWRLLVNRSVDVDQRRRRFGNQGKVNGCALVYSFECQGGHPV